LEGVVEHTEQPLDEGERRGPATMKILVENLDQSVDADALLAAFARFGTVISVLILLDRETGQSRGFGFVEMEDGSERALAELAGTELRGRSLVVTEAGERYDELMRANSMEYYHE
jgi:RNA recognition motif-containing protein